MLLLSGPLQTVVFPEPDRIDPDESRGVAGVVVALHIHADQLLVVQGFGRLSSNDVHLTLKDRQLHATLHVLLRFINAVTDELTLRTVPEPVIDELGELDPETLFDLPNLSVHREGLDVQMSVKQDGSSRGFVDTSGLHSNEAVLHDIDPPHTMLSSDLIQIAEDLQRRLLTRPFFNMRDFDWNTFSEVYLQHVRLIG